MDNKKAFEFLMNNFENIDDEKRPLIIRKDVINPVVYFFIEYKYKNILDTIYQCGGYCFFEQFNLMIGNRKSGWEVIKHLEELNVIGTEYLNNNKYLYLKFSALMYLRFKDDYESLLESKISVSSRSNLKGKPADGILKRSAAVLEYNLKYIFESSNDGRFDKRQKYEVFLSKSMSLFFIEVFKNLYGDFELDVVIAKYKYLHDRSGIYLACIMSDEVYIDDPDVIFDINKIVFHFVIFDFGELDSKSLMNSAIKISRFLESFGHKNLLMDNLPLSVGRDGVIRAGDIHINKFKFLIEICTINDNRVNYLNGVVDEFLKNVEIKNKYIVDCQSNSRLLRYSSDEELQLKKDALKDQFVSCLDKVTVNMKIENVENMFKRSSQKVKTFLKKKDVDRFEQLRKYFLKDE